MGSEVYSIVKDFFFVFTVSTPPHLHSSQPFALQHNLSPSHPRNPHLHLPQALVAPRAPVPYRSVPSVAFLLPFRIRRTEDSVALVGRNYSVDSFATGRMWMRSVGRVDGARNGRSARLWWGSVRRRRL